MENLKKLLGDAYKDGITVEEIDALIGKGKYVDLSTGNYVDKDKFGKVVAERDQLKSSFDELTEKTKDYDSLKTENETFKVEKADNDLKSKLKSLGISEKVFKYVKSDINDKILVIGKDENANKESVKKYLELNPQFASEPNDVAIKKISEIHPTDTGAKTVKVQEWNKNRVV